MLVKLCKLIIAGLLVPALLGFTDFNFEPLDNIPKPYRQNLREYVLSQKNVPVYSFKIIKRYNHNTDNFTQGLLIDNGYLYEGTGLKGRSKLLKMDLDSIQLLKERNLGKKYFGEGIAIFSNQIYQLTLKSNVGFIYDKNSFRLKGSFRYPTQGWGLTSDSRTLIMSTGSASLFFCDPVTLEFVKRILVTDINGKVGYLNELEYINGYVYANIWLTDLIARISPETGKITGWIDLKGINPPLLKLKKSHVLNGIAYNKKNNTIIITGKCWPWLYEIELVPKY